MGDTVSDHNVQLTNPMLLKFVSTIYSQPIAADFRKPVELLYPTISANYLTTIEKPMDLGTLLLTCMQGKATAETVKDGLKLVFANSIKFNEESPMMVAISNHLELFASGLYEEMLELPFYDYSTNNSNSDSSNNSISFDSYLLNKRLSRMESYGNEPLRISEMTELNTALSNIQTTIPNELKVLYFDLQNALREAIVRFSSDKMEKVESDGSKLLLDFQSSSAAATTNHDNNTDCVTIFGLFRSLLKACMTDITDVSDSIISPALVLAVGIHSGAGASNNTNNATNSSTIKPSFLPCMRSLDSIIGVLLVKIQERAVRGTPNSSVWQRPLCLVWAQPDKQRWWPGMLLALPPSGCKVVPPYPPMLQQQNLSRLPSAITKQLVKLKSKFQPSDKTATSTSTLNNGISTDKIESSALTLRIPDGFALVEFFGTHDFGWVKFDNILPFTSDGSKPGTASTRIGEE